MAKRSTNLNRGHKPLMKPSRILDLMEWLGMSEEEIRAALERQKADRSRPLPMNGQDHHHFGEE